MSTNNAKPSLDLAFTLAQHRAVHVRDVMAAAPRALAVIAMKNVDDEPTDAAPLPPLEIITVAQDAADLRDLAWMFTVLAGATAQAADQMDAQSTTGKDA